jgi:hypothetical protein
MHDEPTRETIPNTYRHVPRDRPPAGFTTDVATKTELRAAGFFGGPDAEPGRRKPGTAPAEEYVTAPGGFVSIPTDAMMEVFERSPSCVLRDASGAIVAMWDEARWWTPDESDAFIEAIARRDA